MKKALVALLALAVTGALIAQDAPSLKFSGYLNSGLEADIVGSNDATLKSYAQDADVNGYRMNLDGAYTNGSVGANFELRSAGDTGDAPETSYTTATKFVYLNFGYVWANLASNMVKVKAGLVDDGAWNTAGDIADDSGEGTGVQVQVMPIDGLNFGAGMYASDPYGTAANAGNATYTAGFAYTMANTFGVAGSMKFQDAKAQSAIAGLQVLMVPQLSAALEYQITGIQTSGPHTIAETLSYDLSPVKVGLTAYEWFPVISDNEFGFKINPWVSYAVGAFTPKLGVTYVSNDAAAGKADKNYSFNVKPEVSFAAGSNASIVAAYSFTSYGDNAKVANSGESSKQVFYVDFVWSF